MAKNLIGSPINNEAIGQIFARSRQLVKTEARDNKNIEFISDNNCWIKLTSLASVIGGDLVKSLGEGGVNLARKWVLFGGTAIETAGGGSRLRSWDASYNIGVKALDEFGYRPMPGITSATINTVGTLGSLKVADVKFRVNNLAQLDVIDALFFRTGFTCLLEWGHSSYIKNNDTFDTADDSITVDVFKDEDLSKEDLLRKIYQIRRKTDGNYDGMLGTVTNFNWSVGPDGSYDCTLKLTGIGSVTDSLKINNISSFPDSKIGKQLLASANAGSNSGGEGAPSAGNGEAADAVSQYQALLDGRSAPASALEGFLVDMKLRFGSTGSLSEPIATTTLTAADPTPVETTIPDIATTYFAPGLGLWSGGSTAAPEVVSAFQNGNDPEYLLTGKSTGGNALAGLDSVLLVPFSSVSGDTGDEATTSQSLYCYIKLGLLLAYIHNSAMIYEFNKSANQKKPLIYLNFNPNNNLCYRTNHQFSADPTVCIVPLDASDADYGKLFTINKVSPGSVPNTAVNTAELFSPTGSPFGSSFLKNCKYKASDTEGRIMEIYLNVDYLLGVIRNFTDSDRNFNVTLAAFLEQILTDVQKSLGNVNEFRVGYDDDSNTLTIYDDQILDANPKGKESSIYQGIPVTGLPSVAKSFSLNTEFSTKLGSMLAITAMDPGNQVSTLNKDGSTFAEFNAGVVDRIMKNKTTYAGQKTEQKSGPVQPVDNAGVLQEAQSFNEFMFRFYSANSLAAPREVKIQNLDAAKNYYITAATLLKSNPGEAGGATMGVSANGIMPISINLTMAGISNLVLYEGFCIPGDRLPSKYKTNGLPKVGFIVSGITHDISNNAWNTTIKGSMINLPKNVKVAASVLNQSIKKGAYKPPEKQEVVGTPTYSTTKKAAKCSGKALKIATLEDINKYVPAAERGKIGVKKWADVKKTFPLRTAAQGVPVQAVLNCKEKASDYNNQPFAFQMASITDGKTWTRAAKGNASGIFKYVTIHYTVSSYDNPLTHYQNTWNRSVDVNPASADFTIGRTGKIAGFRGFKKWKSNHYGDPTWGASPSMNANSIGIEMESYGPALLCTSSGQILNYSGERAIPYDECHLSYPVYRGHNLWQSLTSVQISALANLLLTFIKDGILAPGFKFNPGYDILFPDKGLRTAPKPCVVTHGTGQDPSRKIDTMPQSNLLDMLSELDVIAASGKKDTLPSINWTG